MSYDGERLMLMRALRPLADVIQDVILVGGWAHRLHAHHPLASRDGSVLNTLDADLLITNPNSTGPRAETLRQAGFEIRPGGHESPPVTEYLLEVDDRSFEVEFLTHRRGAEVDRHGKRRVTARFGDVVAQMLPFMDVMTHEPWTHMIDEIPEIRESWERRKTTKGELRRLASGRRFVQAGGLIVEAARTPDLDGMTVDAGHVHMVLEDGFEALFGPLP